MLKAIIPIRGGIIPKSSHLKTLMMVKNREGFLLFEVAVNLVRTAMLVACGETYLSSKLSRSELQAFLKIASRKWWEGHCWSKQWPSLR